MVHEFVGNFSFQKLIIQVNAPRKVGVYYCGKLNKEGTFTPYFIGHGDIRKQLISHLNESWPKVTHFGYRLCDTPEEAKATAEAEIVSFHPKYNLKEK